MLDHHVKHSQRQGSRNWNFEITKEAGFQHMTEHLLQVNFVFLLWRLWSGWGLLSWRGEVGRGVSGAAVCGQQIQQRILTLNNSKAKRYCEITLRLLYNNSKKLRGTVKWICGYCAITAKLRGTLKSHCGYCAITANVRGGTVKYHRIAVMVL